MSQIIDPYGQVTTIAVQPDQSVMVTEPAGRWLRLYYKHPSAAEGNQGDWIVYQVAASDGRVVTYNWTAVVEGTHQYVYSLLTSVNYSWDSNLTATYTYQTSNVVADQTPLLSTAIDPLYAGPMWRIAYKYITPSNTSGQIQSENYFDGTTVGAAVTSLSNTFPRTETRADGKTRTFTYNSFAELRYYTDFQGHTAEIGYGISGYTNGALGIPTKRWDFLNHETDMTLDPFTTVTTQTTFPATPEDAPAGRGSISRGYDSTGYYLTSTSDEAGNTTYYQRDANHRVVSISYPDGGSESFTYTTLGQVQTHTLKTGDTVTYQYDSRGLLQLYYDQEHSAAAPNYRFGYDSLDRLNAVTDALGSTLGDPNHTINYTYTSRNQVYVETLPVDPVDGVRHTITNNYNAVDGTLASVVDQLGHTTSYTYDNYRRIKTVTSPGHNTPKTVSVFYGPTDSGDDYTYTDSNPTFIKFPSGKETAIVYDENRRKKSVTVAYGTTDAATTTYNYDANGNLVSTVSPNEQPGQQFAGQSTTTSYDERNRAYSTTDALGHATTKTFDAYGRLASTTRVANGQVTTVDSYDPMNRVLQKTVSQSPDPAAVSKYTYYPLGLLHTFQDPHLVALGSTDSYSYVYDSLGRQQSLTYPKSSPSAPATSESWHYDTAGRNDTFTNRNGVVQTNSFDGLNRFLGSSWNDGVTPSVAFGYDVASRTISAMNANATTTWAYFNDGFVNTETSTYADNIARTVTYTYDDDDNLGSLKYPNNAYTLTYGYTNRNQLNSVVNGSSTLITYGYDPNGNLLTRVPNNSTSSSFIYDGLNRVTHIAHTLNGTTRTFDYGYDGVGNMKWVQRDGGNGDVFGYDLSDQSTSVLRNVANPDTASPGNQTIFYDAGGNRTAFQAQGLNDSYTTNPLNQYTNRNSSGAVYDPTGNMTTGLDGSTYTFDAQNRLLNATKPPAQAPITLSYDGLNRPIKRVNNRAVQAVSAVSRKTHGGAGTFDIPLPLVGSAGIECRNGGASGNFTIVVTFSTGVSYGAASVTTGTGSIASTSISSDNTQITVNLTGVTNAQPIVVTLTGVTDGQAMNDVPVAMRVLAGDVTGNGLVNSSDISWVQSQSGQPVSASNFRADVTVNGSINSSDVALVQSYSGTAAGSYSQNAPTPGTVYSVYDGWSLIGEYAPGATTPSIAYLYGAGGLVKNLSNNEYCYQDGSGSTSHLANSVGALTEYYQYDLHGAPLFYNAGGTQITASAYGVRNLFNGEQWRSDLGLYDLRHRFYSPDTGRFIQADPSGHEGGDNLYRYCGNNPLKNTDPTGLSDGPSYLQWNLYGGPFDNYYDYLHNQDEVPLQSYVSPYIDPVGPESLNGVYALIQTLNNETTINKYSSSPLQSNFNTGLLIYESPTRLASVEPAFGGRAALKQAASEMYHDFSNWAGSHPVDLTTFVLMNINPIGMGITAEKLAWEEMMASNDMLVAGTFSKDGRAIEKMWGYSDEARFALGHGQGLDKTAIDALKLEGVRGFTVFKNGIVQESQTFGHWEPRADIFMQTLQDWANGFKGAPKLTRKTIF